MLLDHSFLNTKAIKDLYVTINGGMNAHLYGTAPSATAHIALSLKSFGPICIVAPDGLKAKKIVEDLESIGQRAGMLTARDVFLFSDLSRSRQLSYERLETLFAIVAGKLDFLVVTLGSLQDRLSALSTFKNAILSFEAGKVTEHVAAQLITMGYERMTQVESPGQFAIRGSIVDIYADVPYRIEFFDVEVDSIRTFDISTQRSLTTLHRCDIMPARDVLFTPEMVAEAEAGIVKALKQSKLEGADRERLEVKFTKLLEHLQSGTIPETDLTLPFVSTKYTATVLDYFPVAPLIIFEEPNPTIEHAEANETQFLNNLSDLILRGEAMKVHERVKRPVSEVVAELKPLVTLNTLAVSQKYFREGRPINLRMKSATNYRGRMQLFISDLKDYLRRGYKVLIFGGKADKTEKLRASLREFGVMPRLMTTYDDVLHSSEVMVLPGSIHEGFELADAKYVVMSTREIYGKRHAKKSPRKRAKELHVEDLKVGDYVVHEAHGIAKYMGSRRMEVQGVTKDYIVLEYRGEDKLFVPIENLESIYKYVAGEGAVPKLNKLNSVEWNRTKQKAKQNVEDLADDLIELYAVRDQIKGYPFSPDTEWQGAFEDSFIYEETAGQLQAIDEVKADMELPKPMDRLLCADVGYGKTEVALRAAFKAVMDGKQVAFLVPTTILAEQHYNTMMERFSDFPIQVALLSRFRSAKDIKQDLENLKAGIVDVVVGTHRLLSKDVVFKDLGLLVIDEEQRFGVRHKEKLKQLKQSVDTLTLTATPIPRTLQMSMIGIRDMSVIDEPPEERFPVQTYVVEHNAMLVREAILNEIERGGQVYYVTNRVSHMELTVAELRDLVPEASFGMVHGQMNERQLEDTFLGFIRGDYDVLVCSTIIETGLDVQNANTIIVTESNRLGLSQLYQLRGRVGRTNRIAYAYFTYEPQVSLTEVATKRLKSIKDFTEFGSGYKLALKDLEIRGSGSLLGSRQSGHINSIGYDLYIKYLKKAVDKRKGIASQDEDDTQIDVKVDSYIPNDYIEDDEQRLEVYKKIAAILGEEDYSDLIDELIDRYGDPPESVSNLMDIALIRNVAQQGGILSITQRDDTFEIKLRELPSLELIADMQDLHRHTTFELGAQPGFTMKHLKNPLDSLRKITELVKTHKNYPKT
ncbi:transcription-repair coupling factor [Peptoniphilus equinus]|uniref:Transcription-repair-coupling factor n=1 Tax=Peptoniphilus equinus TaxID=3016343 RepID=A0ABY7QRT7_9FIRM|nr:transcription-repair coupling factor [Peptoniphilus equinus]WBW49504.1 transcription-repair coupling factor [Peptoniphilus equinus]